MPRPMMRSSTVSPPHTDAHDTNESRNFATIRDSPDGVRSDFGSFFAGRVRGRRSSGRPPPDSRAGGPPSPAPPPPPMRVSPRNPPLVRRDGRYGGALRDSSARLRASAVG